MPNPSLPASTANKHCESMNANLNRKRKPSNVLKKLTPEFESSHGSQFMPRTGRNWKSRSASSLPGMISLFSGGSENYHRKVMNSVHGRGPEKARAT